MTDANQVRINELARELEVKAKAIIDLLPGYGVTEKKTHSSSLDLDKAELARKHFAGLAAKEAAAEAEKQAKTTAAKRPAARPAAPMVEAKPAAAAPVASAPAAPATAAEASPVNRKNDKRMQRRSFDKSIYRALWEPATGLLAYW